MTESKQVNRIQQTKNVFQHEGTSERTDVLYANKWIHDVKRIWTFASQEKYPFLIEMAGNPGSRGGFDRSILSSAKSKSSSRFNDTFALTTFKTKKELG